MATKAEDHWTCSKCYNLQDRKAPWYEDDVCDLCHEKQREKDEGRWHAQIDILHKLVGKEPNADQTGCFHLFKIVPKSGRRFGVKLWACDGCGKVVQAS